MKTRFQSPREELKATALAAFMVLFSVFISIVVPIVQNYDDQDAFSVYELEDEKRSESNENEESEFKLKEAKQTFEFTSHVHSSDVTFRDYSVVQKSNENRFLNTKASATPKYVLFCDMKIDY